MTNQKKLAEQSTPYGNRTSVYREEMIKARQAVWLGAIKYSPKRSYKILTILSCILMSTLIAFVYFGEMTKKVKSVGILLPVGGVVNITSPQSGVVDHILAEEGDRVADGAVFRIRAEKRTSSGDVVQLANATLRNAQAALEREVNSAHQQSSAKQEELRTRIQSLEGELSNMNAENVLLQNRLALAKKSFERFSSLSVEGFVSTTQTQQKQDEMLEAEFRLATAKRSEKGIIRAIEQARLERAQAEISLKATLAQLERSSSAIQKEIYENEARGRLDLPSPVPGTVSSIVVKEGQFIQIGQTLATIDPNSVERAPQLEVNLFSPSRSVGFVRPGDKVLIRYDAYPFQKFGVGRGTVQSISGAPLPSDSLPAGHAQALQRLANSNEPLYRIIVKLDKKQGFFDGAEISTRSGMILEADISLDRRRIWEWLFDPLVTARQRYADH